MNPETIKTFLGKGWLFIQTTERWHYKAVLLSVSDDSACFRDRYDQPVALSPASIQTIALWREK